jgi:hypothetical protein
MLSVACERKGGIEESKITLKYENIRSMAKQWKGWRCREQKAGLGTLGVLFGCFEIPVRYRNGFLELSVGHMKLEFR